MRFGAKLTNFSQPSTHMLGCGVFGAKRSAGAQKKKKSCADPSQLRAGRSVGATEERKAHRLKPMPQRSEE
jgi:hypothetical protein